MRVAWLLVLLVHPEFWKEPLCAQNAAGPEAVGAVVRFGFERPANHISYRFELNETGAGTYVADYPATPPASPAEHVEVPLALHAATVRKIFEQARGTSVYHGVCETKAKNIAQTGIKTLTFADGRGAAVTCAWNYSEKAPLVALQDEFVGMAATLDTGRRLKMEQRFDRLALDREMAFLAEQVKAGQARGLENIAPLLQGLADDTSLLERVRTRAKALLQLSLAER